MAQRTVRQVLAGGALLAALTLTSPSPAHASGLGAAGIWNWLAGLWGGPVSTQRAGGQEQGHWRPKATSGSEKVGACTDLNGCSNSQATGASGPSCRGWNDFGVCIDPNG
jgi:hypothetical protein